MNYGSLDCVNCGHHWNKKKLKDPVRCKKCKSPDWKGNESEMPKAINSSTNGNGHSSSVMSATQREDQFLADYFEVIDEPMPNPFEALVEAYIDLPKDQAIRIFPAKFGKTDQAIRVALGAAVLKIDKERFHGYKASLTKDPSSQDALILRAVAR